MALTAFSLDVVAPALVILAALAGTALVFARPIAVALVQWRTRRLPARLAERFAEEWLAEVDAIPSRLRMLTFAIAIAFTRTRAFVEADTAGTELADSIVISVDDVRVYSEFWQRLAASFVDTVAYFLLAVLVQQLALRNGSENVVAALTFTLGWIVIVQTFIVYRFGGSPGKLLLKLRVVRMDGEPLRLRDAAMRTVVDYVSFATATLGLILGGPAWLASPLRVLLQLWLLADLATYFHSYTHSSEGRALHDILAGTVVVVKVPRVVMPRSFVDPPRGRGLLSG